MIDDQLDALLIAAAPITDDYVRSARSSLADAAVDLREQVVATPHQAVRPAARPAGGARWARRIGAVAAALIVFAGAFVALGSRGDDASSAWAADQLAFAEASPLLLLDGWTVRRADQQPGFGGDAQFTKSGDEVELTWRSDGQQPVYVREPIGIEEVARVDVVGSQVTVYRFTDPLSKDIYRAVWTTEGVVHELGGTAPDDAAFLRVVDSLRKVDASTWLSAMPASVVQSIDRGAVVASMLADIDVPPGLDPSTFTADHEIRDRYQLGAQVTTAVVCGWLDQWWTAKDAGDAAAMSEAEAAIAGSRRWKVLQQMDADGAFPEVIWEVADSIEAGNPTLPAGGGPEDARVGLACPDS